MEKARIYVIDGADGVGKTTLAKSIQRETGAAVIHCSYKKGLDVERLHRGVLESAKLLGRLGVSTVIDRFAPSEEVYGKVFRGGASYNTEALMEELPFNTELIYCRNENATENHRKNMRTREEMFDDMTKIQEEFDLYVQRSPRIWAIYDFDKNNIDNFTKEVTDVSDG